MATKKGMTTGRFGPRYGTRVRKGVAKIEAVRRQDHECPVCHYNKVSRVSLGIWNCRKCGAKFAGGAYKPKVGVTSVFSRAEEEHLGDALSEAPIERKKIFRKKSRPKTEPVQAETAREPASIVEELDEPEAIEDEPESTEAN